jgi:hypothetical protein
MRGDPYLARLISGGMFDRTYPVEQAREAIRYMEAEHARAKVVLTIA